METEVYVIVYLFFLKNILTGSGVRKKIPNYVSMRHLKKRASFKQKADYLLPLIIRQQKFGEFSYI